MRSIIVITFIVFGVLLVNTAVAEQMMLTSPQLEQGGRLNDSQVYSGFGCSGKNTSPSLRWEGAPENTKSFALTVYDPDAPTGSGWWHWVVFNIPVDTNHLPENAGDVPSGPAPEGSVQSRTDYGKPGYGGACPPVGDKPHRYVFTLFALDIDKLDIGADSSAAMVGFFLNKHALAKATLTGYFSR